MLTYVVDILEEVCDLNPQKKCRSVTKLVPRLKSTHRCTIVPQEICLLKFSSPLQVKKILLTKWCINEKRLSLVRSILQKIEQKHGEVAANMDNVEDLINSGVVQNPRKLQATCAGLQKSIEKLDDETQEIRTLMQCLQRSWQSMMNMLVS